MGTVDANIWIGGFDATDASHVECEAFLLAAERRSIMLYSPAFVLVEVACVLARRFRDPSVGLRAASGIAANPLVRLLPLDDTLLSVASDIGAKSFLRGADALYAATSQLTASTIITRDQDLIRRAGAVTPANWLASLR